MGAAGSVLGLSGPFGGDQAWGLRVCGSLDKTPCRKIIMIVFILFSLKHIVNMYFIKILALISL